MLGMDDVAMQYGAREDRIVFRLQTISDVGELVRLQREVYPTLDPSMLLTSRIYEECLDVWPEGQWVATCGGVVVGATTTIRVDENFLDKHGGFAEVVKNISGMHNVKGEWIYGLDLSVGSRFRNKGVARGLYRERDELCRRLSLRGQCTMGMLSGFLESGYPNVESYYQAVIDGVVVDPTIIALTRFGLVPNGLVLGYLKDESCGDACVKLVKRVSN